MDVAGIEAGRDFRKAIEESVATCGVLLVVIGPTWVTSQNEAGTRRLDDPEDFVREEVAAALRREIPVIPVLVRGAQMPRADQLPDGLKNLAFRNCVELTHARWRSDVQLLMEPLRRLVGGSGEVKARTPGAPVTIGGSERERAEESAASAKREEIRGAQFDAATLQRVSRELALDIGPIAELVVRRTASHCVSLADLYSKVAEEIESPAQRERFLLKMGSTRSSETLPAPPLPQETAVAMPANVVDRSVDSSSLASASRARAPSGSKNHLRIAAAAGFVFLIPAFIVGRRMLATPGLPSTTTTAPQAAGKSEIPPVQVRTPPVHDPGQSPIQEPGSSPVQAPAKASESAGSPTTSAVQTAGTSHRMRVSTEISQALLTRKVVPVYPPLARQAHVQGEVVVDADISKDGAVETLRTLSGHPLLVPAAIDAVKQWHYKPYLLNGEPIPVETQITVNFTLTGG